MSNYSVKEINNKKVWERFSLRSSPNTFLQSWNWGEFNKSFGRKIWRLGVYSGEKLVGIALAIKYTSRFGDYLYCPRGPIVDWKDQDRFKSLLDELKQIATKEKCIFIKIDPLLEDTPQNRKIFSRLGFNSAVTFVQVEDAWLLPL